MSFSVVFCVEPGYLAAQATLLANSFRTWAGEYRDAQMFAVQPRVSGAIPQATLDALQAIGVTFIAQDLNRDFIDSPPSNKVFASELIERTADTDFILFTDTDCIFLNPPSAALLPDGVNLAVQPVVKKFHATSHRFDRYAGLWRRMYKSAGVTPPDFVRTTVNRVRIRAYYNAGIAVFRRSAGICHVWVEMMRAINTLVEGRTRNHLDQFALTLAAAKIGGVKLLPETHNYSIGRRAEYAPPHNAMPLSSLTHVHYHRKFFEPGFLEKLEPAFDRDEVRYKWLSERLPLAGDYSLPRRRRALWR
jgi:hypothetical protein